MRLIGDPIADDAAAAVFASDQVTEANELLRTLVHIDQLDAAHLPSALTDYLEATTNQVADVDWDRVHRAQDFFQTYGVAISACLFCASLPSSYAAAKGVQVLSLTARLDTDTRRRVFETGQFLMDVMTRGGLEQGGKGITTVQHVRLMHGAIRHLILERAKSAPALWKQEWGEPINQEDMAATLLAFSYVPAGPLRRLGLKVSDTEAADYLYAWNVIGRMLGIRDTMLTDDLADATVLIRAVKRRQFKPSHEGRELTASLMTLLDDLTPTKWADRFIPMLIRHLIGNDVARVIAVPRGTPAVMRWIPPVFGRVIGFSETTMQRALRVTGLAETFGKEVLQAVYDHERGGIRASFDIPTHLADEWGIKTR